jgi:hypothetical protein
MIPPITSPAYPFFTGDYLYSRISPSGGRPTETLYTDICRNRDLCQAAQRKTVQVVSEPTVAALVA